MILRPKFSTWMSLPPFSRLYSASLHSMLISLCLFVNESECVISVIFVQRIRIDGRIIQGSVHWANMCIQCFFMCIEPLSNIREKCEQERETTSHPHIHVSWYSMLIIPLVSSMFPLPCCINVWIMCIKVFHCCLPSNRICMGINGSPVCVFLFLMLYSIRASLRSCCSRHYKLANFTLSCPSQPSLQFEAWFPSNAIWFR